MGPDGVPLSLALDPAHAFDWVSVPHTNFASNTLAKDKADYYKRYDVDKDRPMPRTEMWAVKLKDELPPLGPEPGQ